jgi:hypothetical protein
MPIVAHQAEGGVQGTTTSVVSVPTFKRWLDSRLMRRNKCPFLVQGDLPDLSDLTVVSRSCTSRGHPSSHPPPFSGLRIGQCAS